eukprot:TRINITY_DN1596_c0_g1_i1.p1 TRINITY_DN1596_c0_g1~~TRINITY_DN1596_c0_g1_i1.p1  ORF type:complete len:231 (-),score=86.27 TRINITY_DN1596_c0_g1_i1:219-872(-)
MFRFSKKAPQVSPQEQSKEWIKTLRSEARGLDREIRKIEREENKVKMKIKQAAKSGDITVVKIMAKEVVRSRKAVERIHTQKAQLGSIQNQLKSNMAMMKVAGVMGKSAQVMASMNTVMNVPQLQMSMQKMAMEMEKAGLIDEMVTDTMEMCEEDMESEVEEEVEKTITEIVGAGFMDAEVPVTPLASKAVAAPAETEAVEQEDSAVSDMAARLAAL